MPWHVGPWRLVRLVLPLPPLNNFSRLRYHPFGSHDVGRRARMLDLNRNL